MATFHCHARSGKSCKGAGARHCDYILGDGKYADKKEVVYFEHGNLPAFAKSGKELFALADKNERSNGRSYRGLTIAIPREASDPVAWSKQLVHEIVGDQAYTFAVHMKDDRRNPHLHVMLSERSNNRNLSPQKYFSRVNKKIRAYTEKSWLAKTKQKYLRHIRTVAPDYMPTMKGGKEKQFSPSQPDKIAGAQAERILPRLEELRNELIAGNIQHTNQGERKMNNEQVKHYITAPLKAPIAPQDEDLSEIYGKDMEQSGWCEIGNPNQIDPQYQDRLPKEIYEVLNSCGLKYCRMNNPKYVTLWFYDNSRIVDSGVTLIANGGTAEDNAKRIIELAKLKKWQCIRLSGSDSFIKAAMIRALAAGLIVLPANAEQAILWDRIQSEAAAIAVPVIVNTKPAAVVVPTLAGIGEKLAKREVASVSTPKRERGARDVRSGAKLK